MIRVLVADDQALVRLGLKVLLESEDDVELAGEAEDGRAALELTRRERPDVVLMDIRMPVMPWPPPCPLPCGSCPRPSSVISRSSVFAS